MSIFSKAHIFFEGLFRRDGTPVPADQNSFAYVAMPEAGNGAYLFMGVDALEQLEADFGEDYFEIISRGFLKPSAVIISRTMAVCLVNGDDSGFPWGLTIDQIGLRLYDAQIRVFKGKTLAEAIEIVAGKAPSVEEGSEIEPATRASKDEGTTSTAAPMVKEEMVDPQSGLIFQKMTDGAWAQLEPYEKYDPETGRRMVVHEGAWVFKQ
ncbi:hypothetical protein FHT87_004593 [Rhizobium sp. BK316]|uniref:hypothetical protein n=1 Tax=Rhizobium sp. BK316 TaxID=2587053 RepID=UPI001616DF42|nr:hypothetical protein [Rhizobium sp. BK316]MBB3410661.1 hypothetical protein [Rhizobium sp. BK316]